MNKTLLQRMTELVAKLDKDDALVVEEAIDLIKRAANLLDGYNSYMFYLMDKNKRYEEILANVNEKEAGVGNNSPNSRDHSPG